MKEYKSIKEIQSDFGIYIENPEKLKKELRQLVKDLHPDSNGNKFNSKLDEINFNKLTSALKFLSSGFEIIPTEEYNKLILHNNNQPKTQESSNDLSKQIDLEINSFSKDSIKLKVSSTAIATALSSVWLFPSTVGNHPILALYLSPSNPFFVSVWLFTLVLTSAYWVLTWSKESRVRQAINNLKLSSVQNNLFNSFLASRVSKAKKDGVDIIHFSRDDFVEQVANFNVFDLSYQYKPWKIKDKLIFKSKSLLGKTRTIGLSLSETVVNSILLKAITLGVIQQAPVRRISEEYQFKISDQVDLY